MKSMKRITNEQTNKINEMNLEKVKNCDHAGIISTSRIFFLLNRYS